MTETSKNIEVVTEIKPSDDKKVDEDAVQKEKMEDDVGKQQADYDYTKSEHFTSEIFKIEVQNVPKYLNYGEFKKFFRNKIKVECHKINSPLNIRKAYVTFKTLESKENALQVINTGEWKFKGQIISAKNAKAKVDAMSNNCDNRKRKSTIVDNENTPRKSVKITNPLEMLKTSTIPLHAVPYEKQLEIKENTVVKTMKNIYRFILKQPVKFHLYIHQWLMEQKHNGNSMLCPVSHTISSPVTTEYRNKCSFTIGYNQDEEVCVGHRIGKYRDNNITVVSPSQLRHIPLKVRKICEKLQQFVKTSDYKPYNKFNHEGYWQDVVVRNNLQNQCLAVISICERDLDEEMLKKLEDELTSCFICNGENMLDSLLMCYTKVRDRNNGNIPPKLIFGDGFLYENLFEYKFKVSPRAFFQCNTPACEVLYNQVIEMTKTSMENMKKRKMADNKESDCDKNPKPLNILLDICCGTGTIGICLSKHFDRIYGVDMCESAIVDARKNAELNGVQNISFIAGKAQDKMYEILKKIPSSANVVAVVDPPRDGLHKKVIESIRSRSQIKSLVYVACSLEKTRENIYALVRNQSKKLAGRAFKPVTCQPLDLFPDTSHVEVVTLYERFDDASCEKAEPIEVEVETAEADVVGEETPTAVKEENSVAVKEETSVAVKEETSAAVKEETSAAVKEETPTSAEVAVEEAPEKMLCEKEELIKTDIDIKVEDCLEGDLEPKN